MTEIEDAEARRRGYWLRRARVRMGITLADAAVEAGLRPTSGSTVSLWEAGRRPMKVEQMVRLARRYQIPVEWLTNPPLTDDERLAEAVAAAAALEREDWEREAAAPRPASGGPTSERRRH